MNHLDSLLERRDKMKAQADEILTRAESTGGLSVEDDDRLEELTRDIDALSERVARLREGESRAADAARAFGRLESLPVQRRGGPQVDETLGALLRGETRGIDLDIRSAQQNRALSVGTGSAGGNTVPTSFVDQLYVHLIANSAIRQTGVTLFQTDGGENLSVPKTTAHSTAALTAEAAAISASDPTFGTTTLGAYKYACTITVSNELLQDTGVDLTGYLAKETGAALGNAAGVHMITGTGSGQPQGAVTGAVLGVTGGTGVTGAFTADNLIDLYFSVIPQYRANAVWVMSDTALAAVRKLKDSQNNYLFVPNNSGGPDMLMGRPVITDPNVAAPALSAKSVLFGDFSTYAIRDAGRIRFERSTDVNFTSDQTVFRAVLRTDGRYIGGAGGVKYFTGAAT